MARMIDPQEREARIRALMSGTNLMREEAEEAIAIILGESFGDIEPIPPLTLEERRRIGLGLTMEEARERRRARARAPEPVEPPMVASLSPEEREEVVAHLLATTNLTPELVDEELDVYLGGGQRVSSRPVLPAERRLIGRRIAQVLERRRARTAEPAARRERA
jgi:hypothetical protein